MRLEVEALTTSLFLLGYAGQEYLQQFLRVPAVVGDV